MTDDYMKSKLELALLLLRLGVGVVFLIWTVNKLVNPEHTAAVFEKFYMIPSLSSTVAYFIGAIQLTIVVAFVTGTLKTYSYMAILLMHSVSTASTYAAYLDPWTSPNLLFFAAFPMLAACWALWSLRHYDTLFTIDSFRQ